MHFIAITSEKQLWGISSFTLVRPCLAIINVGFVRIEQSSTVRLVVVVRLAKCSGHPPSWARGHLWELDSEWSRVPGIE